MSDETPTLYLGDDWTIPCQLISDGAAYPATGLTVRAALIDPTQSTLLVGPVVCDPGHAQAAVGSGKCVAVFTAAAIAGGNVKAGTVLLEVNVAGVGTWLRRVLRVEKGVIAS